MRLTLRIFCWMMLASLFYTGLAQASENLAISDADKIYVNPTEIVVLENGFHVSVNDSSVIVYQLFADANGIYIMPYQPVMVDGWRCLKCKKWVFGFKCYNCGYPYQ